MFILSKMVTVLFIIFLGCTAVAKESEKCDRVQFSFDDQNGVNANQNFTKQSFEKNGKPVYYSDFKTKKNYNQRTIWWDNETNTWLSQTYNSNKITKTKIKISQQIFCFSFSLIIVTATWFLKYWIFKFCKQFSGANFVTFLYYHYCSKDQVCGHLIGRRTRLPKISVA